MILYPRAVVLTNAHPYGGTEMMARSLVAALELNGYEANVLNISHSNEAVNYKLLSAPDLALTISTGALPLNLGYWRQRPDVTHIAYVIDQWPYDYVRVPGFRAFWEDRKTLPNLKLACLEKNNADLIGAYYMPSGPYPAPRIKGPKKYPDRLMMWGSVGGELAVTPLHDDFESTLRDNNFLGLDAHRISVAAESLRNSSKSWGLDAIADALDVTTAFKDEELPAICALDSCLKRWRRIKVARALKDYPLDIYGKGWERYGIACKTSEPDHNHAFGHIVQHYAGLVNVDPNFGWGTNERAMTALAMGVPVAGNYNAATDWIHGSCPFFFNDQSIVAAVERLLRIPAGQVPHTPEFGWEHGMRKLLREIAA